MPKPFSNWNRTFEALASSSKVRVLLVLASLSIELNEVMMSGIIPEHLLARSQTAATVVDLSYWRQLCPDLSVLGAQGERPNSSSVLWVRVASLPCTIFTLAHLHRASPPACTSSRDRAVGRTNYSCMHLDGKRASQTKAGGLFYHLTHCQQRRFHSAGLANR